MARQIKPIILIKDFGISGVQVKFSNRDIDLIEKLVDYVLTKECCEKTKDGNVISKDDKKVEEKLPAEILAVLYGFNAIVENHRTNDDSIFSITSNWSVDERYHEPAEQHFLELSCRYDNSFPNQYSQYYIVSIYHRYMWV